jgi:hypothetical protein
MSLREGGFLALGVSFLLEKMCLLGAFCLVDVVFVLGIYGVLFGD